MRAGNLDRVVTVERRTTGLDFYGTPIETWAVVATMRAQALQYTTEDKEGQRGNTTDATITFRTRWLDNISLENRIIYQGNAYTIRKIVELGRRVGLDVICSRVGP